MAGTTTPRDEVLAMLRRPGLHQLIPNAECELPDPASTSELQQWSARCAGMISWHPSRTWDCPSGVGARRDACAHDGSSSVAASVAPPVLTAPAALPHGGRCRRGRSAMSAATMPLLS